MEVAAMRAIGRGDTMKWCRPLAEADAPARGGEPAAMDMVVLLCEEECRQAALRYSLEWTFAISRVRRAMRCFSGGGPITRTSGPNPRIQLTSSGQTRTRRRTWTRPARKNDSCERCQRWLRTKVAHRRARVTSMSSIGYLLSTKMPKLSA